MKYCLRLRKQYILLPSTTDQRRAAIGGQHTNSEQRPRNGDLQRPFRRRCHAPVTCRSRAAHAPLTRRSRAGHAPVTRRSRAGHAPVTHRSRAGHAPVTRRSRAGHAPVTCSPAAAGGGGRKRHSCRTAGSRRSSG